MSVLGLMENTADIGQTTPDLSALPSTNTERMGAAWDAAQSPDRFWNVDNARAKHADKIIDDLHAMTGERLLNPYGIGNTPTADEVRENVGQPMSVIYAKRLEKLRVATRNAKAGIEQLGGLPDDYLDVDSIDAKIASQSGAARARDERMSGTGGGVGGFIGAMAGETLTPAGIATTLIPVTGGIGTTVARATIGAFAKNIAKEALFQGGTQALATGLQTMVDYQTRKQFGTEQTNAQIIEEIISAGAGGALLGGAFRAAHLGILKLASRGVEIPPAVLDSARVMEEADLYGNKNPLRINPGQMERATDQATSAAALGRAASPEVDVPEQVLAGATRGAEVSAPAGEATPLHAATQAVSDSGSVPDIAARHAADPEGTRAALLEAREKVRVAEEEIAQKYGVKRSELHTIEDRVTPEEDQFLFRNSMTSVEHIDNILRALANLPENLADASNEIGAVLRDLPTNLERLSPSDEVALLRLQALGNEVGRLGGDPRATMIDAFRSYAARFGDPNDAADMVARALENLKALHEAGFQMQAAKPDPELLRLTKSIEATPDNPMQAPRPNPPEPKPQPTTAKLPGESAEDKALLQQAQQVLDSKTAAVVDPNLRRTMELADIEESQARAAVACLAGAI